MKLQIESLKDRKDILLNHPSVTLWTATFNIIQYLKIIFNQFFKIDSLWEDIVVLKRTKNLLDTYS